ncbi:choline dehydrogenase [Aminobacter lissarensis]|uniref:Choline dehydrogenase n=1 Tax=Aminobacter carboxidus TaxID=376165 RepID=A0A8E1WKQ6_9HYPH|nr:GMC family oxidoreductase N-terminal domain-containing protein [Aminobacter lissarensis]MBB6469136.1 choline dehydrogenase [Aminobacter lissarensis]
MTSDVFDFIVVGSGSAGGVVAARLSESGKYKVLCLEAGTKGANYIWSIPPAGSLMMVENPTVNWCDHAEANGTVAGRELFVPRGKLLGGTSAINGVLAVRGQARDYDTWAQMGCKGWSYDEVLPFMKKIERSNEGDSQFRGRSGPIEIRNAAGFSPLQELLVKSANAVGIPSNSDYNGDKQEGIALTQNTAKNGRRQSTATQYLRPASKRSNLKIISGAEVSSLIIDGKRCKGVRYQRNGVEREALATREVILSGGSVGSPKILELSGIGNSEILAKLGITPVHHLPGVGENLGEHFLVPVQWRFNKSGLGLTKQGLGVGLAAEILKYCVARTGFISRPMCPMLIFTRSDESLEDPDILLLVVPYIVEVDEGGRRMSPIEGFTLLACPLRPESVGSVHLRSADPRAPAKIDLRFMDTDYDKRVTIAAVRKAREIASAAPIANHVAEEILPGSRFASDDDLVAEMRKLATNGYHLIGSCRMGNTPSSVVNERLQVHGIEGLRVADASVMPRMLSGTPAVTTMMIGEKCADMVLQAAAN